MIRPNRHALVFREINLVSFQVITTLSETSAFPLHLRMLLVLQENNKLNVGLRLIMLLLFLAEYVKSVNNIVGHNRCYWATIDAYK